jgi:RNA polymerase subunit RPABC4/transcription elongation factor Spt4
MALSAYEIAAKNIKTEPTKAEKNKAEKEERLRIEDQLKKNEWERRLDAIRSTTNGAQQVIITKSSADSSSLTICNNCNHAISKRANVCPKCGYALTMAACNICKATIPKSSVTCPECGDSDPFEKPSVRQVEKIGHSVKRVEHIEANDLFNQVIPRKTHNSPKGVGGWLLLLVAQMMVIGPVLGVVYSRGFLILAEENSPHLIHWEAWTTYKTMWWITLGIIAIISFFGGWKLLKTHKWSSVRTAVAVLVITGPVAHLFSFFVIPYFSLGIIESDSSQIIGKLIASLIYPCIGMSYLSRSMRVRNTYIKDPV